jgi:hypothetical protein
VFNKSCVVCCSKDDENHGPSLGEGVVEGDVAHSTPLDQIVQP